MFPGVGVEQLMREPAVETLQVLMNNIIRPHSEQQGLRLSDLSLRRRSCSMSVLL